MFHALVASGPTPRPGVRRYLAATLFHAVLVAAAVALSGQTPTPHPARAVEPIPFRVDPPAQPPVEAGPPPERPSRAPLPSPPDGPPVELPSPVIHEYSMALPTVSDLIAGVLGDVAADSAAIGPIGTGPAGLEPLTAETVDEVVAVVRQPAPRYPAGLAAAAIGGGVELSYVVDSTGRVEPGSIRTLRSTHPAFAAAARDAILDSRYRPARLRGRPVRQLVRQTLSFRVGR